MTLKLKETRYFPRRMIIVTFFALIVVYSFFQARFLVLGPGVSISYPTDGEKITSSIVAMEGSARNAAWLTLNGRQIFTDEEGSWSEELIVPEGLSIMTVKVRDRFGRETEERVRIYLALERVEITSTESIESIQ